MSYDLGANSNDRNKTLCDYLVQRFGEYERIGGVEFLKTDLNNNSLRLSIPSGNHMDIVPSFCNDYVDIRYNNALIIDADIDTETNIKLMEFLEDYVENDSIFAKGNPLYSEKREKELPKWQEALERIPSSRYN